MNHTQANKPSLKNVLLYLLLFCLVLLLTIPSTAYTSATEAENTSFIYLPIVYKPQTGIQGKVTWAGKPAGGITLTLRFYNGNAWSTKAATQTEADGTYVFNGLPSLESGQFYYVRYDNTSNDHLRLFAWLTPALVSYQAGSYFNFGEFDIGGILLGTPGSGAMVDIPCKFSWNNFQFRPPTGYSYEFNLYNYQTGNPYFYANVGGSNTYSLNSLPNGFYRDQWYAWDIWVYDTIGGFGVSYDVNYVEFRTDPAHVCALNRSFIDETEEPIVTKDHPAIITNDNLFDFPPALDRSTNKP